MKKKWIALALLGVVAQGQERLALTARKAAEIALAPDGAARVALAQEAVKQQELRRRQALAALLPNVDASWTSMSFTRNLKAFGVSFPALVPGYAMPVVVGPVNTNDVRAAGVQSLFDLSAIRRYQAAGAAAASAKAEDKAAQLQTVAQVARAYAAAQRTEGTLQAAQANVALAARVLRLAQSQKAAGTGTGIDVVRAETQVAAERQRELAAGMDRDAARLQLLRAIGLPLTTTFDLADELKFQPAGAPDAAAAVAAARSARPELAAQQQRRRAAELSYKSVALERVPTAAAFGDYGSIGVTTDAMRVTHTGGVTVKVPLWDGGRRDARRAEAASALRQESVRAQDAERQVELEVRLALDAQATAEKQVAVALEALQTAGRELEQAERRYKEGVAISLEVTDAQARVARAREGHVNALARHRVARIDLAAAMGAVDAILD